MNVVDVKENRPLEFSQHEECVQTHSAPGLPMHDGRGAERVAV